MIGGDQTDAFDPAETLPFVQAFPRHTRRQPEDRRRDEFDYPTGLARPGRRGDRVKLSTSRIDAVDGSSPALSAMDVGAVKAPTIQRIEQADDNDNRFRHRQVSPRRC